MIKEINGENYEIPDNIKCKPHKHREEHKWISLWFYRQRRKTLVLPDQVKCDKIITSKLEYQKDTFYMMSQMSEEDQYFNYYFRLKDKVKDKNLVKKNGRFKKINPKNKAKKIKHLWKDYKAKPHEIDEDGKYIVRFH
jgi:hypothetical protein